MRLKVAGALLVAGLIALVVWLVSGDGEPDRRAARPATAASTTTSAAEPTDADLDALAAALGLPRDRLADFLANLEPNEPDYRSSDPAAPSDGGVGIVGYGAVAQRDDVIFAMELASAPSTASGEYQYGLGVGADDQPQSTPNPNAPDGFGRLALSRVWYLSPGGTLESYDPAAGYAVLPTGGAAALAGRYVMFRIPESEVVSARRFVLQSFLRRPLPAAPTPLYVIVTPRLVEPLDTSGS